MSDPDLALALHADDAASDVPRHQLFVTLLRSLAGLLAGVLVAGLAAWYFGVKGSEVVAYVGGVSPWVLLGCAGSAFLMLALQALRWHRVMGPLLGLRYVDAYKAQIVGVLFNALLPARGGDLLRVQYLGRRTGKSRATILGTEIVDRWLDYWGWVPTFLVLAVVSSPPSWLFKALGVFGAVLSALGAAMVLLTRRGWEPRPDSRLGKFLLSLRSGVGAFRDRRMLVTLLLVAPLPWLWEPIAISLAAQGFGLDLSLMQAFSVMIGFNLAMVVPSPGAIGTVEAGGVAALLGFGFDQNKALAFMFVYHFTQLLPGIAGGAAVLVMDGERMFGARPGARAAPTKPS